MDDDKKLTAREAASLLQDLLKTMDDDKKLTAHEAASLLQDLLKTLIARTGNEELAVKQFNEIAQRAGVDVRVSIVDAKDSRN